MSYTSLNLKYADMIGILHILGERVKGQLQSFCSERHFLFEGRVKSIESLEEKLDTGLYPDLSEISDLYGCSIITNLPGDEADVVTEMSALFTVDQQRSRFRGQTIKPADSFRYDSTRLICTLKVPAHVTNPGDLFQIRFEVQVRTIYDYAWAKTTHALSYKGGTIDWKKQRLAAQLKAATEQIETMIVAFDQASAVIPSSRSPDFDDQQKILAFFQNCFTTKILPSELEPNDWKRFSNNVFKFYQQLAGKKPTGGATYQLEKIDSFLSEFATWLEATNLSIPRSLSIFQLIVCVHWSNELALDCCDVGYYIVVTGEMRSLFPKLKPRSSLVGGIT